MNNIIKVIDSYYTPLYSRTKIVFIPYPQKKIVAVKEISSIMYCFKVKCNVKC